MRQSGVSSPRCSPGSGTRRLCWGFASAAHGLKASVFPFLHSAQHDALSRAGPDPPTPTALARKAELLPAPPAGTGHREELALGRLCPRWDALGKEVYFHQQSSLAHLEQGQPKDEALKGRRKSPEVLVERPGWTQRLSTAAFDASEAVAHSNA